VADGALHICLNPLTQIPSEPSGTTKEVTWFRQVLRCLRERTVKVGPGLRLSYKIDGTLIELASQAAAAGASSEPSSSISRMRIVSVEGDYVTARNQVEDGTVDDNSELFYVAKPPFLRVTGINGITRDGWTYAVSSPANTRTLTAAGAPGITAGLLMIEDLRPSYVAGDTIYATLPMGKTSVAHPTISGQKLSWIDLNLDPRSYGHKRVMLDACVLVNGTPTQKRIVFEAGPIP